MTNPLLYTDALPPFATISPDQVDSALSQRLNTFNQCIAEITADATHNWETVALPLETQGELLNRTWSPVSHLNNVMNSDAWREAYNTAQARLVEHQNARGQNSALFTAFKELSAQANLNAEQRQLVEYALRDFHLQGVDLPPEKKARYREISQELARLSTQFSENVLDATNAWYKHIEDEEELAGLPESTRALAKQNATQRHLSGWLITLHRPCLFPVLMYAENPNLRQECYRAYNTRASDQDPKAGQWDNTEVMNRILALRHELAVLLGFPSYAHYSLATKMAKDPAQVMDFLEDLTTRSLPQAREEFRELQEFARTNYGIEKLAPSDVSFYAEKLRQQKYKFNQEELRPWFELGRVLDGMFAITNKLYGIHFQERQDFDSYHDDVRYFDVLDEDQKTVIAGFYLDPFARAGKRGGAWMDVCRNRADLPNVKQLPIAYLVCNFTPSVADQPSLLTHDEVTTLFHEFGHGLNHMLTRINYPSISGINNVAWDAVELPSQFMENWCWQPEALTMFARHWQTGEALPEALFQKMLAARNFQAAMLMVRQLEFALFDFRLHLEYDPTQPRPLQDVLQEVISAVGVTPRPAWNRFAHAFTHIFDGGYAAGYYSYKWAEVLAADAFSRFEEEGIFNPVTGHDFRTEILGPGGSRDAMTMFIAFRGRPPEIGALLRHNGIQAIDHTEIG